MKQGFWIFFTLLEGGQELRHNRGISGGLFANHSQQNIRLQILEILQQLRQKCIDGLFAPIRIKAIGEQRIFKADDNRFVGVLPQIL